MDIITNIIAEFWSILSEMSPYLLFGFLVAGFLSVFISPELVERNLGGRGIWPVIKASLFGIPLPLCSCGVIPVAASLHRHGANKSATTSFLLSTPQTGVDSIMVTYSLLGPVFAVFRPLAALVTGLIGGSLVEILDRDGDVKKQDEPIPVSCEGDCCSTDSSDGKIIRALKYGLITLPQDIGKALIIGLIIAAGISLALPDDFFAGLLGTGLVPMLVMMAAGIPVYVCATASVPVAAAFMAKGISAGAALVFLMTGPATNAAAIATIWKVLGKKTAFIYLATVAGTALLFGLVLDYLFSFQSTADPVHTHQMIPGIIENGSAVILLLVLGNALYKSKFAKKEAITTENHMATSIFQVKGMTCSHCSANVKRSLEECSGVKSANVDLKSGEATVIGEGFNEESLRQAIEKAGYSVVN